MASFSSLVGKLSSPSLAGRVFLNMMGMAHAIVCGPGLAFVFFKEDYTARLYGDYNKH